MKDSTDIEAILAQLDYPYYGLGENELIVGFRGEHRDIGIVLSLKEQWLCLSSRFMPARNRETARLYRFCLDVSFQAPMVRFALDSEAELHLKSDLPVSAVSPREVEARIKMLFGVFNTHYVDALNLLEQPDYLPDTESALVLPQSGVDAQPLPMEVIEHFFQQIGQEVGRVPGTMQLETALRTDRRDVVIRIHPMPVFMVFIAELVNRPEQHPEDVHEMLLRANHEIRGCKFARRENGDLVTMTSLLNQSVSAEILGSAMLNLAQVTDTFYLKTINLERDGVIMW